MQANYCEEEEEEEEWSNDGENDFDDSEGEDWNSAPGEDHLESPRDPTPPEKAKLKQVVTPHGSDRGSCPSNRAQSKRG